MEWAILQAAGSIPPRKNRPVLTGNMEGPIGTPIRLADSAGKLRHRRGEVRQTKFADPIHDRKDDDHFILGKWVPPRLDF